MTSGIGSSQGGELPIAPSASCLMSPASSMCTSLVSIPLRDEPSVSSTLTPDTSPEGEPAGASVSIGALVLVAELHRVLRGHSRCHSLSASQIQHHRGWSQRLRDEGFIVFGGHERKL